MRGPFDRAADRLLAAPRVGPDEAELGPRLDALGGEIVRLRSRDGLKLTGRWLEPLDSRGDTDEWPPDPHEAILLLHGYSGSIAPDIVEYAPFLSRTAGVLGLDFRGHGGSDPGPTTFGLLEVEDVAGALAWLGERGVTRVALFGTSMGAITALGALAVLGDGRLVEADIDPFRPRAPQPPPRPLIVGVVADSATPELAIPIASRAGVPVARRWLANRVLDALARRLGADPRATEPGRVIGMLDGTPILLIHGEADRTTPVDAARRLAAMGDGCEFLVVPGAGHSAAHLSDPALYEARVTSFLRRAFTGARGSWAGAPIIAAEGSSRPASAGV